MKRLSNADIAEHLEETGLMYAMLGEKFKPRAYERAAEEAASFGQDIIDLFTEKGEKGLREIPGVGPGISAHIASLIKTGTFSEYEKLRKKSPIDILGLTRVEHVGPKTALLLYKELGVKDVADLERAAKAGKIAGIPGLGKKTEDNILKSVGFVKTSGDRKILGRVLPLALEMEQALRKMPGVRHAYAAGSIRRRQETIGDLDFLVTTSKPETIMEEFAAMREVSGVLEQGPTKMAVRLSNGMRADLRVVGDASLGAALQYFTGSKDHNVIVRTLAIKKGLKLNEYGLWKGETRIAASTEEALYKRLGLPYIEPELRTASGEVEAARAGKLPKIIAYGSIRGDLQVQSDWTDGAASIEVMAAEAKKLGLDYMAVTDHTKALAMVGGLDEKTLAKQGKEIDRLNARSRGFKILKGTECDILKDGSMDLNDAALASLDFVGGSVHSHFNLSETEQTARVIKTMRNPHVDCVFHPTGRVIGKRPAYSIDMPAVLKAAKSTGTAMEIDAYPDRSDLRDEHVRMAVELGVKLIIDTDAHHPSHLQYLDLGVAIARRGWAEKKDVLNARPLKELLKWLKTPKDKRR